MEVFYALSPRLFKKLELSVLILICLVNDDFDLMVKCTTQVR